MTGDRSRTSAYRAAAYMARDRMTREAPEEAEALGRVEGSDVVVVGGSYDHVELVLEALEMPFVKIGPGQVARAELKPEQLVVINCPGTVGDRAIPLLARFVSDGGSLFTTDWALAHVIEPAFPGVVAYNHRPTGDDVVRIEVKDHDNPFLVGVMDEDDDPLWWLEGSSYPIRVLDRDRVRVLIESRELATKYGEAPVAITFDHGRGEVFHMISHYYLQRTELRTARHRKSAVDYAEGKGVAMPTAMADEIKGLSLADVESAESSARLMANVVARKKMRSSNRS